MYWLYKGISPDCESVQAANHFSSPYLLYFFRQVQSVSFSKLNKPLHESLSFWYEVTYVTFFLKLHNIYLYLKSTRHITTFGHLELKRQCECQKELVTATGISDVYSIFCKSVSGKAADFKDWTGIFLLLKLVTFFSLAPILMSHRLVTHYH